MGDFMIINETTYQEKNYTKGILKLKGKKKTFKKNRNVQFSKNCKKQDGFSARFYAKPEFLQIKNGFLKPKSKDQIEKEIKLGLISSNTVRSLIPVSELIEDESSEDEPYDPAKPNDYEVYKVLLI